MNQGRKKDQRANAKAKGGSRERERGIKERGGQRRMKELRSKGKPRQEGTERLRGGP